tara:strand:+ start:33248 stop:34327 length:1080 start_codon:yes stop_codon:yes gene_type:complete
MSIKLTSGSLTEALKKSGAGRNNNNDQMWKNFLTPTPTPEGSYYRMRLLWFVDENSNRNIPFIEQYNHTVYDRDENGKLTVDFVTCPTSPYLNIKNAWQNCPICQYSNNQFELAKSTNFSNKVASANHRKMRRQFVAFIPAYIISDPNVPENNGRIMLFLIRDRDIYKRLCEQVKGKEHESPVFNGEGAVDLAVVVSEVAQKNKDGSERINQYTGKPYTRKELKFQFGSKPHDIDIPVSQIEAIDFDSLYSYSTEMELKAFLAKHTAPSDLPEDDFDISIGNTEDTQPIKQAEDKNTENIVEMGSSDVSDTDDIDIDDIDITDVDQEEEVDKKEKEDLVTDEINVDDVLKDIPDLDDLF